MHLDITKYIKSCKIEKLEIINNIGIISLYNIDDLVIYNEVSDVEFNIACTRCSKTVFTCTHYKYLVELIFTDINEIKSEKVFLNVHDDFEINLCKTEFNGNLMFNIKHIETGNVYLYTLDFSSKAMILIKRSFYIIKN